MYNLSVIGSDLDNHRALKPVHSALKRHQVRPLECTELEGFLRPDRPKHDSWWPPVGQNFKNRDMVSQQWRGAIPKIRGTGRIDKSGDSERSISIRYGGVKPPLPFNG